MERATYKVERFLSKKQIKTHNLKNATCSQSLKSCDKSDYLDIDGEPNKFIKRLKNNKYVVKTM